MLLGDSVTRDLVLPAMVSQATATGLIAGCIREWVLTAPATAVTGQVAMAAGMAAAMVWAVTAWIAFTPMPMLRRSLLRPLAGRVRSAKRSLRRLPSRNAKGSM